MPARKKDVPLRDVAKRVRRGRKAYIVPTERSADGFVAGESFLERNNLLLMCIQVGIKRVSDQGVCIDLGNEILLDRRHDSLFSAGKAGRRYTPDIVYELADGQKGVCESKPSAFLDKHAEKHELAGKILTKYGQSFTTLTDERFTPAFISNLENLLKAVGQAQRHHAELAIAKIDRAQAQQKRWRTEVLKQSAGLSNADIFFGLAYGALRADMTQPLFSSDSWVEAAYGCLDHLVFEEF